MGNAACCEQLAPAGNNQVVGRQRSAPAMLRSQSSRLQSTRPLRLNSSRSFLKKTVRPDQNILVKALLVDLKEDLKLKFKSSEEALDKLGFKVGNSIDKDLFTKFLIRLGYCNAKLNAHLFQYLDRDQDGYISKAEFVAFCAGHDPDVVDFKARLQSQFKSAKDAFHKLDTSLDNVIDQNEFQAFCANALGYTDPDTVKRIFEAIDDDHNAFISKGEFMALLGTQGEVGVVAEFREAIKKKFRSTVEAFEALGGDDGLIGRSEFQEFLDDHNLLSDMRKELIEQIFSLIDDDNDGYISKNEFRAVFLANSVKLLEFRETLRAKYKTRSMAFEKLGGKDNGEIDMEEFHVRLARDFGFKDRTENEQLFRMIDVEGDGIINRTEFKKFFLISSGSVGASGGASLRASRSKTSLTDTEPASCPSFSRQTFRRSTTSRVSQDTTASGISRLSSGSSTDAGLTSGVSLQKALPKSGS